jgi:hypothetical protein
MRASAAGNDDRTARRTAERASSDGIVAAPAIAPLAPGVVRTDTRSEQSRKGKGAVEWRVLWEGKGGGVFMERRRHEADQIMACFAAGVIYARR